MGSLNVDFVNNCLRFVPVTLLVYDWALTFGDEVELIWQKRLKMSQIVFLVLRYGTLAIMSLTVLYFAPLTEHTTVKAPGGLACPAAMVLIILFVQVLLQLRVYAMYNRSRVVLWTNLALFVLEFGVTVYLVLYLSKLIKAVPVTSNCRTCDVYPRAFALTFVAPLLFEYYLMFLAARKTCRNRSSYLPLGSTSLIDVLIRGSVQYFALVAFGMAVSIILFVVAPRFALWVDFLSDATGCIGGTRLILSIRKALLDDRANSLEQITTETAVPFGDHDAHNVSADTDEVTLA